MHQNQPVYVRGNTGGLTRMLAGELPMYCGVQFGSSNRILMKDAKAPLKMVFADPVPVELGENEAVVRTGKHPPSAAPRA
jgi:hypothetical protein